MTKKHIILFALFFFCGCTKPTYVEKYIVTNVDILTENSLKTSFGFSEIAIEETDTIISISGIAEHPITGTRKYGEIICNSFVLNDSLGNKWNARILIVDKNEKNLSIKIVCEMVVMFTVFEENISAHGQYLVEEMVEIKAESQND